VSRARRACAKQGAGATGGCLEAPGSSVRAPACGGVLCARLLTLACRPGFRLCGQSRGEKDDEGKGATSGGRVPATAGMNLQDALQKKMERRKKKEKVKQGPGGYKPKLRQTLPAVSACAYLCSELCRHMVHLQWTVMEQAPHVLTHEVDAAAGAQGASNATDAPDAAAKSAEEETMAKVEAARDRAARKAAQEEEEQAKVAADADEENLQAKEEAAKKAEEEAMAKVEAARERAAKKAGKLYYPRVTSLKFIHGSVGAQFCTHTPCANVDRAMSLAHCVPEKLC